MTLQKIKQNKSDDKGGLMSEDLSQVEKNYEVQPPLCNNKEFN